MATYPAKIDVAVLILFFNRPKQLSLVFEQVKQARPARLFLYQDGPRGPRDREGIEACRRVVEDIDWDCEVHRHYCEQNQGCDPSEYLSQKWAFSIVDRCIVLEDDDIPSQSFFPFCKEMLDRYADDTRVWMVSGYNTDEVTPDVPCDYFFSSVCSIWGWASWRRVIDTWDETYSFLDDPFTMRQLRAWVKERDYYDRFIPMCYHHRDSGKPYYETIFWASMMLNHGLAVTPTRNLITNLGPTDGSTHYGASLATLPRRTRRLFTMQRFELDFPLRHPAHVIEHVAYKESLYRAQAWNHPWVKVCRSMEELWLSLRHGQFRHIGQSVANRLRLLTGRHRFS